MIYTLLNMYNRDLNYKPKELKNVLASLSQSQIFEIYANILELQNSCLVLMPNDGQDVYNKYIEYLLLEIMRSVPIKSDRKMALSSSLSKSKGVKSRITSENFHMRDNFHEEYIKENSGEPLFDTIQLQLYAGYCLVPIMEGLLEEIVPAMNDSDDSDSPKNAIRKSGEVHFFANYQEVCVHDLTPKDVFQEAFEPIFTDSNRKLVQDKEANAFISMPSKILVLGGTEELQCLVQNLT
jgi:hypothetical protein